MAESSSLDILSSLVPGFGAYRSEQKRRDDDVAVRKYLVQRLQECKRSLQQLMSPLVDQAKFASIVEGESLRVAIDLAQARIQAAVEGYSSWFESKRVDETKLKRVIELDNDLVAVIDRLHHAISSLDASAPNFSTAQEIVANLKERFSRRSDLLSQ
jgi:sugar diacid utilization regulator